MQKGYVKIDKDKDGSEETNTPGDDSSHSQDAEQPQSMLEAMQRVVSSSFAERTPSRVSQGHLSFVRTDNPSVNSWAVLQELRGTRTPSVEAYGGPGRKSWTPGDVLRTSRPEHLGMVTEQEAAMEQDAELGGPGKPEPPAKKGLWYWISLQWWPGANLYGLILCVTAALLIKFVAPKPDHLSDTAWSMLAIFVATIMGLILEPLPTGAVAYVAMTMVLVLNILPFKDAFMSFTNDTIWLIVSAFFFAKGVEKTGLGERIATYFTLLFGKSSLGMSYAVVVAETLIAAAMPSTTARAGGVFVPILVNLSKSFESHPRDPSARMLGSFLLMAQFQASINSSAMFLTGAAQNSLCLTLAAAQGVVFDNDWVTWFKNAVIPALIGLIVTPTLVYFVYPPKIKKTPEARVNAQRRMRELGRMKWDELVMAFVLLLAISFWVAGKYLPTPMSSTTVAFAALSLLLLTGVLTWRDCIQYSPAWDTLLWFGVLIGFSSQLNSLGVIKWIADSLSKPLAASGLPHYAVFIIVQLVYFAIHYMFASQTAHVAAIYPAFLAMLLSLGFDGHLSALSLAFTTNLFGSITHYASGQAAAFYTAGYLPMQIIIVIGAIVAVFNLSVWVLAAPWWWKLMGLYDTMWVGVPVVPGPAPGP